MQGVQHVEPRGPAGRQDRRADAREHGDRREPRELGDGSDNGTSWSPSARVASAARSTPSPIPSAAPISAVMTLSWRIMRRACRRVMPIARSMPSSRVRSNTESTSVFTIPNRLTTTENPSST